VKPPCSARPAPGDGDFRNQLLPALLVRLHSTARCSRCHAAASQRWLATLPALPVERGPVRARRRIRTAPTMHQPGVASRPTPSLRGSGPQPAVRRLQPSFTARRSTAARSHGRHETEHQPRR
jgi:hypothetical protein